MKEFNFDYKGCGIFIKVECSQVRETTSDTVAYYKIAIDAFDKTHTNCIYSIVRSDIVKYKGFIDSHISIIKDKVDGLIKETSAEMEVIQYLRSKETENVAPKEPTPILEKRF